MQAFHDSDRPVSAREIMGGEIIPAALQPALAITSVQGSPLTSLGGNISPLSTETSSLGLALERLII